MPENKIFGIFPRLFEHLMENLINMLTSFFPSFFLRYSLLVPHMCLLKYGSLILWKGYLTL